MVIEMVIVKAIVILIAIVIVVGKVKLVSWCG